MEPIAPMRVRPLAETEWPAFVEAYGGAIVGWFRRTGLPRPEAEELVRDVMRSLGRDFGDPVAGFRPWLQRAGHAAWCRVMQAHSQSAGVGKSSKVLDLLLSVREHDSFLKMLDDECSHERRHAVLSRVQPLSDPVDWEVFYRAALEGVAETDIAVQMQRTPRSVRAAVFRTYRLLENELCRWETLF